MRYSDGTIPEIDVRIREPDYSFESGRGCTRDGIARRRRKDEEWKETNVSVEMKE